MFNDFERLESSIMKETAFAMGKSPFRGGVRYHLFSPGASPAIASLRPWRRLICHFRRCRRSRSTLRTILRRGARASSDSAEAVRGFR